MPFNFALEANNLGRIFNLSLSLILLVDVGLLVVGDITKSTLVIGELLNTQHLVKFGLEASSLVACQSSASSSMGKIEHDALQFCT